MKAQTRLRTISAALEHMDNSTISKFNPSTLRITDAYRQGLLFALVQY